MSSAVTLWLDDGLSGFRKIGHGRQTSEHSFKCFFHTASADALVRETFFSQAKSAWQIKDGSRTVFESDCYLTALEYAGQTDGDATFNLSLKPVRSGEPA